MNDPIVDEVRRVRDAFAARFNYDLDAIFQDIKQRESKNGLKFVQGVARQPACERRLELDEIADPAMSDATVVEAVPMSEHERSA
jgi:hypothetical protein